MTDVNEELLREVKELHRTIRLVHKEALKKAIAGEKMRIKELVEEGPKASIPKRRKVYDILTGSKNQTQIADTIGMDISGVSRLIKKLREEDLIDEKDGNTVKRYDIDWR
jgi:DNA-binding MarR family transcriptional regulator